MKVEKISITREDVCTLLTMEAGGFDYWGYVDYHEGDYVKAKDEMIEKKVKCSFDTPCYEDVLAYMICDTQYPVYIVDNEEGDRYQLTKSKLEDGFLYNIQRRPKDGNLDEGDTTTGDCILQYAIFGDIIYG